MGHGGSGMGLALVIWAIALLLIAKVLPGFLLASIGCQGLLIWTRKRIAPWLLWAHGLLVVGLFVFVMSFSARSLADDTGLNAVDKRNRWLSIIALVLLPVSTVKQVLNRRRKTIEGTAPADGD